MSVARFAENAVEILTFNQVAYDMDGVIVLDRIEHRKKPCSEVCSIEDPHTSEGFYWIKMRKMNRVSTTLTFFTWSLLKVLRDGTLGFVAHQNLEECNPAYSNFVVLHLYHHGRDSRIAVIVAIAIVSVQDEGA